MAETVGRGADVSLGVACVAGFAVGRGVILTDGRGVGFTVGFTVGLGVSFTTGFGVRGAAVGSGAGVPGTMSASPAPERPERRIG